LKTNLVFCFLLITNLLIITILYENSFAENLSPRQQWKQFADPDLLTCKKGFVLLQKNNGYPACVTPSTYLKLIDRGFTKVDFTLILNRHDMMTSLMQNMASNQNLMSHWHDMMIKNPTVITKTMTKWISQMKENPELLANIMGPITSEPKLQEKMIYEMKKYPIMENSLKQNQMWMDSVHRPMMGSEMDQGMHNDECGWCPEYIHHKPMNNFLWFSHYDTMMDLMYHIWINDKMNQDMHEFMLENPEYMAQMSDQMMGEILGPMMDDPEIREQMVKLMLEHQGFMNLIRHEN